MFKAKCLLFGLKLYAKNLKKGKWHTHELLFDKRPNNFSLTFRLRCEVEIRNKMFGGGEPIAISSAKGDWDMVS